MASEVPEYEIRLMKREEIPQVFNLWRETNLWEGTHSIDTWFEYDPEGFYVAVTNDGTVIGACAGVLQHNNLAFVGLYVVKSTFRRRGIGRKILNKVMERVGDRNAGIYPVPELLENYRDRVGFPVQTDWCSLVCTAKKVPTSEMLTELAGIDVKIIAPEDTEAAERAADYDTDVIGFSRSRLFPIMFKEKDSVTVMAINSHDSSVCGYGSIKKNITGNALVSPLIADNSSIAELVLYHLVKSLPVAEREGVTLIAIDSNKVGLAMVDKLNFKKLPDTPHLYRSKEIAAQLNKIFAQHNSNFSVL